MTLRLLGFLTILLVGCQPGPTPDAGTEDDAGTQTADGGVADAGQALWPVAALRDDGRDPPRAAARIVELHEVRM